jgi:type I restriction enzyme, S subunit
MTFVPADVPVRRLRELVVPSAGLADGPFGSHLKSEHYATHGARVIRLQNIGRGSFLDYNKAYIPFAHFQTLRRYEALPGDVLVASLGDGARPSGRACIVPAALGPAVVKADCFRVRPDLAVLRPKYLVHFLNSPFARELFGRLMRGATRPRVTLKMLADIRVPVPPPEVQDRIVEVLEAAFEVLERAETAVAEQVEASELLAGASYRQAFHGVVPVATPSDARSTPPGWRWRRLTDVARLESGHTPSRRHAEWWGGDIPWIALPDIRALDGRIAQGTSERTNELGIANSSARVLPAGTVVMSRTASVGFVTIMGRPMATSQDFVNWVCGPEIDPFFLAYALRASREYIRGLGSGAVHKTVYMPTLHALQVCMPTIEVQRRSVADLDARLRETARLESGLRARADYIATLPAAILRATFAPADAAQSSVVGPEATDRSTRPDLVDA